MCTAIDPPGLLIWASLPNGLHQTAGSTQVRLSVMLSPRLLTSSTDATVDGGEFPHFDDWPATVRALAFEIAFDGVPDNIKAAVDRPQMDSATWKALFSGLKVDSHVPQAPGLGGRTFQTYNARVNYDNVVGGYEPRQEERAASASQSRRAARLRLARKVGTTPEVDRRMRATIDQLRQRYGAVTAALVAALPDVNVDAVHFAEWSSFFDGLNGGVTNRIGTAPADAPVFDFHQAITAVAKYPALMRKLGLVLDLTATLDAATVASLPAEGRVRVELSTPVSGWQSFAPWTAYALIADIDGFFTRPASDALGVAAGMLVPTETDTMMVLDFDAVAPGVRAAIADFVNSPTGAHDITFPAPRSAGLSLARDGLAATLQQMLKRQATLEYGLPAAVEGQGDLTLTTEDLLRGFRVDIRPDASGGWLSLHYRNGSYVLPSGTGFSDAVDEGFISLQTFNPDKDDSPVLYAHESLFRWTGWSLSVPRPGKTIGPDGKAIERNTQATSNLPITVDFKRVPNTLPRLRFGEGYHCRLRVVDLAGNGLPQDAVTLEAFSFRLGKYLRFDPVIAPALAMRDAPRPAEAVEHIVIRSEIDSPAAETAERLVVPPKTSVQMAEWHGMFDTATGVDSNAFQIFAALDGNLPDAPYGASLPALPYLPDPIARGASLQAVVSNEPPTDPIRIPFDGTWPACRPFRLRLVEGDAPPAWDPAQRLFTVSLGKGRTATYALGSYMDTGALGDDPKSDDVKDLALFNFWDSIVTPRRGHPALDRKGYWEEITAGRNEQLTPHRTITLVHVVPRPLLAPSLDPATLQVTRSPGSTDATFTVTTGVDLLVDLPSTGQLEMLAEWNEPFDDGVSSPEHTRIVASARIGRLSLDADSVAPGPLIGGHHEFHDTRHRAVTCWLTATTRYAEYFPDATRDPQVSAKVTIDVPCSAHPLPPEVLYVVPTFDWRQETTGSTTTRERRGGLRVYLDRPWYSSGDGERLAVRMAMAQVIIEPTDPGYPLPSDARACDDSHLVAVPPQEIRESDVPFVTQWGTDPAFVGDSIASPFSPLPQHFLNAKSTEFQLIGDNVGLGQPAVYRYAHATFDVAFEPPDPTDPGRAADPGRDPHNGRWYCDIEIDAGTAYFPFLRLALARFQPCGQFWSDVVFYDMRFSPVSLVHFVQLAPGRTLNIVPDVTDPSLLHVTIVGSSFTPNEALGNLARTPPVVVVEIEMKAGPANAPLWIPMVSVDFTNPSGAQDPGTTLWQGDIRLPYVQGSKPMRLTVKEYEVLPSDPPSRELADTILVRRIVFAASVELVSPFYSFATIDVPGSTSTFLRGINNAGQIVGQELDANGAVHSLLTDTRVFSTFDPPGFASTFPGTSFAVGINDNGEIVGGVRNNDKHGQQAYVRDGETFTLFPHPIAGLTGVTVFEGVNNAGVRVGSYVGDDDTPHGIIQTGDTTTLLEDVAEVPPNAGTFIFDINNLGQMVGGYFDPEQEVQHGFFSDGETFVTIDFPGSSTTWLNGINDRGLMVGSYFDDVTSLWHGFLTDGKSFTVFDFPDVPGPLPGTFLTGIDNSGRIVGYFGDEIDRQNRPGIHGCVATPLSSM